MKRIASSLPVLIFAALLAACAAPGGRATSAAPGGGIEAEARAFMESYARDLIAGDREAVAARYDRAGAYTVGNGEKTFDTFEQIRARYLSDRWQPPAAFAWRDLSYEPAGPDAIMVIGTFDWTRSGRPPLTVSYTSLLVRKDGALRIRLEDESVDPRAVAPPCPRDSARG